MAVNIDNLHQRIADTLGWSMGSVRSMSLVTLREMVRTESPKLAHEITQVLSQIRTVPS